MATAADPAVMVRLTLPAELVNHFEAIALVHGHSFETELISHLEKTKQFTSSAPIYLDDNQAKEVRRVLGGRINTAERLVDMIQRLVRLKVAGQTIEVSPARQDALTWWAKSYQLPIEKATPIAIDQALGLLLKC